MEDQQNTLSDLRSSLADLDGEILNLVKKRLDLCRHLALVKVENGLPLRDLIQEQTVLERYNAWAKNQREDHEKTKEFAQHLMDWCLLVQKCAQK